MSNRLWRAVLLLILFLPQLGLARGLAISDLRQSDCTKTLPDDLTFEILARRVRNCQVKSIEELLAFFPQSFLSNYALMYSSSSLQSSTPLNPRAILFGNDASLVVSFNGSPTEPDYDNLELMQFRQDTSRFEFRRISLPQSNGRPIHTIISQANPSRCLMCHQEAPKPNWSGYILWPGAFGAEDEASYIGYRTKDHSADESDYRDFLKNGKNQGRYRFLKPFTIETETANENLGDRLQRLNMRRVARQMANDKKLFPFRYVLLGAATCTNAGVQNDLSDFIPAAIAARAKDSIATLIQSTIENQNESFNFRLGVLKSDYPNAPLGSRTLEIMNDIRSGTPTGLSNVELVALYRWIVEDLAGSSMQGWSTEMDVQSYVFNSGSVDIDFIEYPLVEAFFGSSDVTINRLYNPSRWDRIDWSKDPYQPATFYSASTDTICAYLKKKSREALTSNH
jgi:hypothetical protein